MTLLELLKQLLTGTNHFQSLLQRLDDLFDIVPQDDMILDDIENDFAKISNLIDNLEGKINTTILDNITSHLDEIEDLLSKTFEISEYNIERNEQKYFRDIEQEQGYDEDRQDSYLQGAHEKALQEFADLTEKSSEDLTNLRNEIESLVNEINNLLGLQ